MKNPFLSSTLIGYAPIVDDRRVAIASRVSMLAADGAPLSPLAAYKAFAEVWKPEAGRLLLDLGGSEPEGMLLAEEAREDLWLEVPAQMVAEPSGAELVGELHARGFKLVLLGRPLGELSPELVKAFRLSLIPVERDRRLKESLSEQAVNADRRSIPYALVGVGSIDLMERGFATGASAIIGWPFEDAMSRADKPSSNPSFGTISQLLQMANAGAEPQEMDTVIKRDPSLAFRLLRYLNSPAFGLRVEVQSFQHALMMLGYAKLKKWLALLIATAARDANLKPVMFASLRRGFFLERLVADMSDPKAKDEAFILGVFSLLDKLFSEPFAQLFEKLQIPEGVRDALVDGTGPYMPYLRVAQALEGAPSSKVDDLLTNAFIGLEDCNRALVGALNESGMTQAA